MPDLIESRPLLTGSDTDTDGGKCPVPEWMLRPLAFALPLLLVAGVLLFVLHR